MGQVIKRKKNSGVGIDFKRVPVQASAAPRPRGGANDNIAAARHIANPPSSSPAGA